MSENGPYNQPPQNPYGGGDGTGGQPPYGQPQGGPYGDPGTGGQPGYGQAPYPGGPGVPGQDQGMYAGGQPPYGAGPAGPGGYPPAQPPQGGGSKAGLWVVIGGGAVIIVLVIAVVVMLVTNGNRGEGEQVAVGPGDASEAAGDPEEEPESTEEEPEEEPANTGGDLGDPPHGLPTEPCDVFTETTQSDFHLSGEGRKNVSDNRASCTGSSSRGGVPDNADSTTGYLDVTFKLPFSATDSPEAASTDIEYTLENLRGDGYSDRYSADDVEEDKEIDGLGSEAYFISTTMNDSLGNSFPEAMLVIRQDNLIIEINYELSNYTDDSVDFVMPDNVEESMLDVANEALNVLAAG
ncbi:DUF3558 domain-containing protein [Nocardiopsis metallicus]|uniref:DUF3558 domain-containing protein n=1 Tax=Nocardiopsis metallicus TaxID=179819 RepID=A0A840WGH5_9ACTN|nr:DUF3558 domain-containing protein [Nocardiopsis metallicus]MBB5489168.1 hypothetical protein [Nocardiopsis metallicus]